jgi:hypothetical protein
VTPDAFRRLALELPGATEGSHMGHPDFRANKKIFATLSSPSVGWAMVKLAPAQQEAFTHEHPTMFVPVGGGWGRGGATHVVLHAARVKAVRLALEVAWKNVTEPAAQKSRSRRR